MTGPRHLWSGDWQRESADAAQELARRQATAEVPSATSPPSPPRPSTPSAAARALAYLRSLDARAAAARALAYLRTLHPRAAAARALAQVRRLRPRGAVLLALVLLLSAGVGYAAVSSLVSDGGGGSSGTGKRSFASSPARNAAPAWLGVQAIDFPPANGVMVVDVVPGSPADAAGLQPGDVITQIGNRPVQSPTELESALAGMHAGQKVEIQYEQGPNSYTTHATLRAPPANGP